MRKVIFYSISAFALCFGLSAHAVSDGKWESFCRAQTDANFLTSCNRADRVCELHGFNSSLCKDVRQSVLDQTKPIKQPKIAEPK